MNIFDRWTKEPPNERIVDAMPRYCGRCGKPLERVTESLGFSTTSGRPQFRYWLACPDAERKDTPYVPHPGSIGLRARFVTCEMDAWSEVEDRYIYVHVSFVSCEPWPKAPEPAPVVTVAP